MLDWEAMLEEDRLSELEAEEKEKSADDRYGSYENQVWDYYWLTRL